MLSNLSPAQEPVAYGAIVTAVVGVLVVFAPRFGVHLSSDEQTAIAALVLALAPIVVGYLVRTQVTPNAKTVPVGQNIVVPVPAPPTPPAP